jgi:hypothetical protein
LLVSLAGPATSSLATGRRPKLAFVVNWFERAVRRIRGSAGGRVDAPRIRPRSASSLEATKVDLHELVPDTMTFLGKAAYVQLMLFENLSRVVTTAPTIEAKSAMSEVASAALAKYQGLTHEIERQGGDPAEVMKPFALKVDAFQRMTQGHDWHESVTTCYLSGGFLNDFFARLATGLPSVAAARVATILSADSGEAIVVRELLAVTEGNARLSARLALWGRRLVGDTMLIARWALRESDGGASNGGNKDEERLEPVFTELIAAHTRRMDALGLTA